MLRKLKAVYFQIQLRKQFGKRFYQLNEADIFDVGNVVEEICSMVEKTPGLAGSIPKKFALSLWNRVISGQNEVEQSLFLGMLLQFLRAAPVFSIKLLRSDDPILCSNILRELPAIAAAADEKTRRKIMEATLRLLNKPELEKELSFAAPITPGEMTDDKLSERYRFRRAIAEAVVGMVQQVPQFRLDLISKRLRKIYLNTSSVNCMRAVIYLFCNLPVQNGDTLDCIEYALDSKDLGVVEEAGVGISICADRISDIWRDSHTDILLDRLGEAPLRIHAELSKALGRLIEAGYRPRVKHCRIMIARLFEVNKELDKYESLVGSVRHLRGRYVTHFFQSIKEIDTMARDRLFNAIKCSLACLCQDEIEELRKFVQNIADKAESIPLRSDAEATSFNVDYISNYLPQLFDVIANGP